MLAPDSGDEENDHQVQDHSDQHGSGDHVPAVEIMLEGEGPATVENPIQDRQASFVVGGSDNVRCDPVGKPNPQ